MTQEATMLSGKPAGFRQPPNYEFEFGSEIKAGGARLSAHNKDGFSLENEIAPESMNKDGKEFKAVITGECEPKSDERSYSTKIQYGGVGNDSVKSWSEINLGTNSKFEFDAGLKQNFAIANDGKTIHTAFKANYGSSGLTDLYTTVLASGLSFGNAWFRMNALDRIAAVGATVKNEKHTVTSEVYYDLKGKNKGIGGIPLFMRLGSMYHFKNMDFVMRIFLGKQWTFSSYSEMPFSSNISIAYWDRMNLKHLYDSGKSDYKFGVSMEIKL